MIDMKITMIIKICYYILYFQKISNLSKPISIIFPGAKRVIVSSFYPALEMLYLSSLHKLARK